MTKLLTTLTAFFFSTTAAVAATPGMQLENILINGDDVRIEFSSKVRDCGVLINEWDMKIGPTPLCRNGVSMEFYSSTDEMKVLPGQNIQMCKTGDLSSCTDFVQVREAGDVNGDQAINVIDLMLTHRYIMGIDTGSWPNADIDLLAADINDDGDINVIDILFLIELLDLD